MDFLVPRSFRSKQVSLWAANFALVLQDVEVAIAPGGAVNRGPSNLRRVVRIFLVSGTFRIFFN